jgi:hypothetical protein
MIMAWVIVAIAATAFTSTAGTKAKPVRTGAEHFALFKAVCLETSGRIEAVKQHAKAEGWRSHGEGEKQDVVAGWFVPVDGGWFAVHVVDAPELPFVEKRNADLERKPYRTCEVRTRQTTDLNAVRGLKALLNTTGCDAPPRDIAKPDTATYWPMRGQGYALYYGFARHTRSDAEGSSVSDTLVRTQIGTDERLVGSFVRTACKGKPS